ncbi:MAG: DEAD/DEAH box helicase [Candidatus Endomicrobiellum trichonymphae]|uniref:DEAD/DEAH box helicase n=1 Tax=Endomicrobium trichonymphae TaxID=1408204 RepID=UPI0027D3DF25|nr:MAG: DEAD/DEAH box helicase [Candidatus Endomicrobium trichonymphae]
MTTLKFNELNLSSEILKAVEDLGFEEATPIQSLSIPKMMTGIDIIGQSQTGTGKTAAFGIPVLEKTNAKNKVVQSVILCPTRELAIQVAEELKLFSKYKKGINIVPVYGGQPIQRQMIALSKGAQIVIGTPGRVIDHLERRTLKLDTASIVILDEADEMLDMGFRDDIELILKSIPEGRQTVFFSATMPKEFLSLTKKYQHSPETIKVVSEKLTVPSIEQYYFDIKEHQKLEALTRCLDMYDPKLSLVFCNTKKRVDEVTSSLQARGYYADAIHGDMNQSQRNRVMSKFRNGSIELLIATDVAARGIDVDGIDMVFNFDVPKDDEDYVHRIGRTGRAGKAGKACSFVSGKDIYKLRDIQRYTKANIKRMQVPSLADVENTKETIMLDKVKEVLKEKDLEKYAGMAESLISDEITSLDVAAALLKIMLASEKREQEQKADISGNINKYSMTRLFINIGKKNGVRAGDFVGAITGETGINGSLIGDIKILDAFSFVEVPQEYAVNIINALHSSNIKGKKVSVEPAKGNESTIGKNHPNFKNSSKK